MTEATVIFLLACLCVGAACAVTCGICVTVLLIKEVLNDR